jgi:hypothetical protein
MSKESEMINGYKEIRIRHLKKLDEDKTSGYFNHSSEQETRFQMKKTLFDWHKTLKQLQLTQETNLCVQLLYDDADSVNQGIIILNCIRLNLNTRLCAPNTFKEILWNVNNGATLNSLKESICKSYMDQMGPADFYKLSVAKRLGDRFQWILLKVYFGAICICIVNG